MRRPLAGILLPMCVAAFFAAFAGIAKAPALAATTPVQTRVNPQPPSGQGVIAINPQGNLAGLEKAANREGREKPDIPFLEEILPERLTQTKVLRVSLSRWIGFLVVLPLLIIVARLVSLALIFVFRPFIRRLARRDDDRPIERVKNPFSLFMLALAIYGYVPLAESAFSRLFWNQLAATIVVISLTWLGVRVIGVLTDRVSRGYEITASSGRIGITRLVGQFAKGLASIIGAATILGIAGINLTAVLTGVGVGGIAIAFAAQKTLENLFGGIMIASDQPIRVGDFCRAGGYSGTVEAIGLRSTRIRTLDRTLVSVPNGQLSVMSLENFALRDKIRLNHTLGLRGETAADQLRYVLYEVRKLLADRQDIEQGSARVRLVGLRNGIIEIELFAYVLATGWETFLAIQEEVLLRIIDVVQAAGTALASQAAVLQGDEGGNDPGKGRKGDKDRTRKRRSQGDLL